MEILEEINMMVQKGNAPKVVELVNKCISEGVKAEDVLNKGLLKGMMILGERFKKNEAFVPEVLIAARAMNGGIKLLEGELLKAGVKPIAKAVIGTIKGDLHDIGKNLVGMMLKGAGFEVIDLGVNCDAEKYITAAEENGAKIIAMSALLTTTMVNMKEVVEELKKRGLREKYIVMVGGAPVNETFCREIGADYYEPDATSCSNKAKELVV
ncbi:MAG: corrinoid protein [Fusobacteriaceae bacterium]